MREVNRSAVLVTAKQPFLDWVRSVDSTKNDLTVAEIKHEPTIYLVPECESDEEFADWIDRHFDDVFQEQLAGWWADERWLPKTRTGELFQSWFDCRFHSLVLDVAPGRLSHIDCNVMD